MKLDDPRTRRLEFAGVSGLTVLTWYALPDAVRSRPVRVLIKIGLLGITAAGVARIPQVFAAPETHTPKARVAERRPTLVTLAAGGTLVSLVGTIWAEKAIYARGERRRARGVRCAHTPAAAVMALVTTALAALDWPKLLSRHAKS